MCIYFESNVSNYVVVVKNNSNHTDKWRHTILQEKNDSIYQKNIETM